MRMNYYMLMGKLLDMIFYPCKLWMQLFWPRNPYPIHSLEFTLHQSIYLFVYTNVYR
ncbi:hypothetical protein NC651_036626 [Populus alba x Populus x berolinensis]|nr:hypothetical protein NC651_036626 [Populus alba x Populus x berolinensis]